MPRQGSAESKGCAHWPPRGHPRCSVRRTRLARRGNLGIAAVAMVVVTGVGGGSDKRRRRAWEIQALAYGRQSELGPDAADPDQPRARPGAWSGAVAFGVAGPAADLARRSALATTDTELRLMASAATIGLSRIPNAG